MSAKKNLRKNNLKMFEEKYPAIHVILKDFQPLSELKIDKDGNADIVFDGQNFYGMSAKEFAEEQLAEFWKVPTRFAISPPNPDSLDDYAGPALFNILKRAQKADVKYHHAVTDRKSFTVAILGIGLGYHIDDIVEVTDCRALVIADLNYEFLYHSLDVYDWKKLDETITKRDGFIRFVFDSSPEGLAIFIRLFIRGSNTAGLDGLTFYMHQRNAVLNEARAKLFKDINLIVSSLGFFYDETLMLSNVHKNFCKGDAKYYVRPHKRFPVDAPVFVVGSGPSLDECLPIIKENADRAFIISAGTSLRPLVVNGIIPDIHIEQENLNVNLTVEQVSKDYDISSVLLVAATSVDPEASGNFKNTLYYSRRSLSPFPIYFDDLETTLERPHNTVVNASFSLVQELGFREFYFFGVDCGTVNQARHHSKDAYQYTEGALHVDQAFTIPVTANLGGDFYTSIGLAESLDYLESAIAVHMQGNQYYNCSDGAYISGTIPLLPKKLDLPEVNIDKYEILQSILDGMPTFTKEKFDKTWDEDRFRECVDGIIDHVGGIFDNIEDFSDFSYQIDLNRVLVVENFFVEDTMSRGVVLLLRGTIFQIMMVTDFYRKRVTDPEDLPALLEIVKDEVAQMLEKLRDEALNEVGNLNEKHAA
jgi:hypothetical protein